ncbi:MAG TPA: hypothetical protein VGF85_13330 [Opitutaceae bacterium]|jgi:hypothetical protein
MAPTVRIPEKKKRPGVFYAVTNDGIELPVIDVTLPSFAVDPASPAFAALRREFVERQSRGSWMPRPVRRMLYKFLLRDSVLWRGLTSVPRKGFLSGMNTYLLKIGAENLGDGYTGRGDRQIAASFPAVSIRNRLQTVAIQLSRGLVAPLQSRPAAELHFINIAGGHASDTLNALLLLGRDNPGLVRGRRTVIHVLDLESNAPDFGRRALAALSATGGPLHGADIGFEHIRYDWSDPAGLARLMDGLAAGAVIAASSEGGLFEYGTDEAILANLRTLAAGARDGMFVVGSVTRDDRAVTGSRSFMTIPVIPRGMPRFGELLAQAGWELRSVHEQMYSDVVTIAPRNP